MNTLHSSLHGSSPRSSSWGRPWLLLATAVLPLLLPPAQADDAELFLSDPDASATRANVLFIIDTSGSMDTLVLTQASFDSGEDFSGCYDSDALYFATSGATPACDSPNVLPKAVNRCAASRQQLEQTGYYADVLLGWDGSRERWDSLSPDRPDGPVECESDRGIDGNGPGGETFAANGSEGPWAPVGQQQRRGTRVDHAVHSLRRQLAQLAQQSTDG